MGSFLVNTASRVTGKCSLLGDKSIACRSVILSSLACGKTTIHNFPPNDDCLYAMRALRQLGVRMRFDRGRRIVTVFGRGLSGLRKPKCAVFVGDSGTTLRLMLGVLAGQDFLVTLTAATSLSRRPMLRVTRPLRLMGAKISSELRAQSSKREEYPPLSIRGGNLKAITYKMPVASAQVKSAILLAGLYADKITRVIEPHKSRDHTERMLKLFKADVGVQGNSVTIRGGKELVSPGRLVIPGDISSASFFLVLAAILHGSRLVIRGVGLNPSRLGVVQVLQRMGARIRVTPPALLRRSSANDWWRTARGVRGTGYEPAGDLTIAGSSLRATVVKKQEIPSLIDELPILMVAACFAKGRTVFEGVAELRVKETDRVRSMTENLTRMGAVIQVAATGRSEDIIVQGVSELRGSRVKSFGDHRTAMSMVVAGLKAKGETRIDGIVCISKSFPNFLPLIRALVR